MSVEIIREGTDLSHTTTVWCATRLSNPPSASAGRDYIPSSSQITFGPGQTSQVQDLTVSIYLSVCFKMLFHNFKIVFIVF